MTLAALVAFYFVHLAAAMSPGPAVLLATRTALQIGMKRTVFLAIGIGLGACLWAVAALLGLAILFEVAPTLLLALKVFGGAYLGYLAFKIWRHAPDPMQTALPEGKTGLSNIGLVWLGITTQMANPKAALFFGTIFLPFIENGLPIWASFTILGIIFFNDCGWNIIIARIFSLDRTRKTYMSLKTIIDRVFAGLLAALSAKIVLT